MKVPAFPRTAGFTLLELLTVMAIIVALAALTIKGMGYANQRAGLSRAEAEIAAMSAALESYKADNGEYPPALDLSGTYGGNSAVSNSAYATASRRLYVALCGDKTYMPFKKNQLSGTDPRDSNPNTVLTVGNAPIIVDPFGNVYGYSTSGTYNPTFDLWCTGGKVNSDPITWVKNW